MRSSARGWIRWSSNILIGSIPIKKACFPWLLWCLAWSKRGSSIYLLHLSPSLSACLNKLAQQLNYSRLIHKTLYCPLQTNVRRINISYSEHVPVLGENRVDQNRPPVFILLPHEINFNCLVHQWDSGITHVSLNITQKLHVSFQQRSKIFV